MSQPRRIVPGATYLLTRRSLRRHLLFRPDAAITRIIIYALAVSAERHGIRVHALCAMSTHVHLVVTDVRGVLPRFLQSFHRLIALGTKALRAWEGAVWDHEPTSVVHLLTREAVVEKIAYTLANPVLAGIVRHAQEWPGAKVRVGELGRAELRAKRPEVYFKSNNPQWPDEATVLLALPPEVESDRADRFRSDVAAELERQEARAHAEVRRRGLRFMGAERACKVSPYDRASSPEPLRGRNPTFAVGRGRTDAGMRAIAAVRAFRAAYRGAIDRWRSGVRDAVFPVGTWLMRVLHGASVDDIDIASAA
ncbi:transposase [Polyangium aurulentum]|uniref:transposase n=1 Tax=Polyangium aurulentum TaxID=2567896 RepID=UPI0010AEA58F|nr:transposase [Polyangium aurulentum]UQA63994.1 transposase [Polyangium aurulentum]